LLIIYKYNDNTVLFHHATSFGMLIYVLLTNFYGGEMVYGLLQGEVTNHLLTIADVMEVYNILPLVKIAF